MASRFEHKSQHFVSRTYLAAWCDASAPHNMEPYVWVFKKDSRVGRRKAPHNIFEETDFYTVRGTDGSRDLTLEHKLRDLAHRFARIAEINYRASCLSTRKSTPTSLLLPSR